MARRGRNNRIFYKPMEKAIFDYDSNDENKKNKGIAFITYKSREAIEKALKL